MLICASAEIDISLADFKAIGLRGENYLWDRLCNTHPKP